MLTDVLARTWWPGLMFGACLAVEQVPASGRDVYIKRARDSSSVVTVSIDSQRVGHLTNDVPDVTVPIVPGEHKLTAFSGDRLFEETLFLADAPEPHLCLLPCISDWPPPGGGLAGEDPDLSERRWWGLCTLGSVLFIAALAGAVGLGRVVNSCWKVGRQSHRFATEAFLASAGSWLGSRPDRGLLFQWASMILSSKQASTVSRKNEVIEHAQFDVFLSHNSKDKAAVRTLAKRLKDRGLNAWLDDEQLVPGRPWQEALEEIIQSTKTAAVLVGKDGLGPWETPEMRGCLSEFVNRGLPVIPILLPGATRPPELPLFLKAFTWVDLRDGITKDGLDRLEWGITGVRVESSSAMAGSLRRTSLERCSTSRRPHRGRR